MEYLGMCGNSVYLMSTEFDEAIGFDQYGELISNDIYPYKSILLDCYSATKIDMLSILGVQGVKYSEIYFKGQYAIVKKEYMSIFQTLNKLGVRRVNGLVYTFPREDIGTQVILPVVKDSLDLDTLMYAFPGIKWTSLKMRDVY